MLVLRRANNTWFDEPMKSLQPNAVKWWVELAKRTHDSISIPEILYFAVKVCSSFSVYDENTCPIQREEELSLEEMYA